MNPCDARGLVKLNADRTVETINLVLGHTVAVTVAATVRDATPLGKGCACRGKERDRERERGRRRRPAYCSIVPSRRVMVMVMGIA